MGNRAVAGDLVVVNVGKKLRRGQKVYFVNDPRHRPYEVLRREKPLPKRHWLRVMNMDTGEMEVVRPDPAGLGYVLCDLENGHVTVAKAWLVEIFTDMYGGCFTMQQENIFMRSME